MTVGGGYRLALHRNQGHAGSEILLCHFELKSSRQTVNRWESLLACSLLLQSRSWYCFQRLAVEELHGAAADASRRAVSWEIHTIGGDSTHTPPSTDRIY